MFRSQVKAIGDEPGMIRAQWVIRLGYTMLEHYARSRGVYLLTSEALVFGEAAYGMAFAPANEIVCEKCKAKILESGAYHVDESPPVAPVEPPRNGLKVVR